MYRLSAIGDRAVLEAWPHSSRPRLARKEVWSSTPAVRSS